MTDDLTQQKHDADRDAADVDLAEAERAADQWLALALRKLSGDSELVGNVAYRVNRTRRELDTVGLWEVVDVLRAVADHLEGA